MNTIGKFATAIRNSRATAIATAIDAGATPGTLKLYTGNRPVTSGGAIDPFNNILLGTLTFSKPCSASIDNGVLTFSAIAQDTAADNNGTASWARINNGDGGYVMDLDVSNNSGSGDIKSVSKIEISGFIAE